MPIPLSDDPYVAVRQEQLVDIDTKSEPQEALSKAEELQPLGSRVPLMSEEFEASEPSCTRTVSSYSLVSSDSIAPISPDHHVSPTLTPTRVSFQCRTARMAMRTQPTLSPGMSARIAEAAALSPSSFHKRYKSSYEASLSSSPTLPVRKRYRDADDEREGQGLVNEGQGLKDNGLAASESLGLGYGAARRRVLESTREIAPSTYKVGQSSRVYTDISTYVPLAVPVQTSPSLEWSLGSLSVSPSSPVVPSPIASLVATLAATISVRLVRYEIFSQSYRFRSLEREHKRAMVTFSAIWRLVLALEAWSGQTDAQRAALWHAIYDIQRENHNLRRQLAEERRERLELTDRVARMERRQESGGE
uniref:Uncharacterized protein n=1 Tax=Tanacetum cinerariifolium TaxID=118510 RepID=A0A6L2MXI5_TANCI|nr:hypothetical protein [Tanacetum cinerariifolium]